MRLPSLLLLVLAAGLATFALWFLPNRPVTVDAPPGGRVPSLSFAPFRDGQSPFSRTYPSREQIDQDLRILSAQAAGLRTYTSLEGMAAVPELAGTYGLSVTMGAWLDSQDAINEAEVAAVIRLANQYPQVIRRVIVGNEALLRGTVRPEALAGYLARVRAQIRQPVSYADVWEFWLKYPQIAEQVDFITIHLLPYWEDQPAGVEEAARSILTAHRKVAERFPGKPILVGEAGWPTAGRSRGPAVPGVVNKARFDARFMALARENGFDYNLIEAFDQNWKIRLEGTVGGKWGLYRADRSAKFTLGQPVVEDADWPLKAGLAWALAAALLLATLHAGPPLPRAGAAVVALFATGLASGWVHAADIGWSWHSYGQDLALAALVLLLQALLIPAVLLALAGLWRPSGSGGCARLSRLGAGAAILLTGLAVVWTLLLTFDGRYRDVPVAPLAGPCLALGGLALVRAWRRPAGQGWARALSAAGLFASDHGLPAAPGAARRRDLLLGGLLVAGALASPWAEGGTSREALIWGALQIILAVPYLAGSIAGASGRSRARAPA
jgi:exo-beta-1,3-glucanase (GH17 family)